jgi:hypothetical protein
MSMDDLNIPISVPENTTGLDQRFEFGKARIAVKYQPFSTGC